MDCQRVSLMLSCAPGWEGGGVRTASVVDESARLGGANARDRQCRTATEAQRRCGGGGPKIDRVNGPPWGALVGRRTRIRHTGRASTSEASLTAGLRALLLRYGRGDVVRGRSRLKIRGFGRIARGCLCTVCVLGIAVLVAWRTKARVGSLFLAPFHLLATGRGEPTNDCGACCLSKASSVPLDRLKSRRPTSSAYSPVNFFRT